MGLLATWWYMYVCIMYVLHSVESHLSIRKWLLCSLIEEWTLNLRHHHHRDQQRESLYLYVAFEFTGGATCTANPTPHHYTHCAHFVYCGTCSIEKGNAMVYVCIYFVFCYEMWEMKRGEYRTKWKETERIFWVHFFENKPKRCKLSVVDAKVECYTTSHVDLV